MSDGIQSPLTIIGVGASFAFSSVFYHLYQEKKLEIQKLKQIPSFHADQDLLRILKVSSERRLHYVAVEGVVQPVGEPLSSKYVPQLYGVVQKITRREHWKVWNSITNLWVSKTSNAKETNNTVPFQLVAPGTYLSQVCVRVESPMEAQGNFLQEVHRGLAQNDTSLLDTVVQSFSGERLTGREEREEMLSVGSMLTGYGEVVLEGDSVMKLRPPRDGRAYVLLPGDHRSFIRRRENSASIWMGLSALTGITGATLLGAFVYSSLNRDRKNR